jgi:hypothetical protein
MAKLNKMYYYTSKREKKLNCYYITLPKEIVERTKLNDAEIDIKVEEQKIILSKK